MPTTQVDVAIVGAGIVGLAHAYLAARSGRSVVVFERNPAALGASIRNFGMIWPIGQPAGRLHKMALRSREIWLDVLQQAHLPFFRTGSLHVTYREDEAAVGQEFAQKAPSLGYECAWLSPKETLARTQAVRAEGLLGSLWSPAELTVDPREVIRALPQFLAERYKVQFHFNTAVQRVESSLLHSRNQSYGADCIIVASGDDFQTLFPECFHDSGLTRCKLQMMRTVPQPQGWRLGPSLAFGLTFKHYPTFQICSTLPTLKNRIARETSEFDRFGIHVMVSQNSSGELTLGDSHEYGLAVNIFDDPTINRLILDYAKTYLRVPTLEIAEQWHGVYAKHAERPYISVSPLPGVRVVTVTTGIGMTMSFGIAEETFTETGAAA
ncbi:MAG TPA: TIGR03364 family FAD-dependent oxidoreductase [Candidatus Methylomirabilis sp.]|nr:TIGR03364 family FAD-dependent oxidoreductase [Candidatus Methylomirabilis sp.]